MSDFRFFKTGVFLVLCVFSNLFLSKLPQFLLESKRFASVEDFLGFWALCDLPEIFVRKISNFFSTFLSCFRLCKIDFLFSPVGKKDVLESHAYSFGYFWHCKILTIVFFSYLNIFTFLTLERAPTCPHGGCLHLADAELF